MTLVWRPGFSGLTDADAIAYVAAVEAADGQALEFGVGKAINDFIVGCKLDGTWNAIKASCILAGARTLNGALVPLVGTAPTPFNFDLVGNTDYNRKTGLIGNGTSKYLNSNRSANADPQNSFHAAAYVSTPQTGLVGRSLMGAINTTPSVNRFLQLAIDDSRDVAGNRSPGILPSNRAPNSFATGLLGTNRASSSAYSFRFSGQQLTATGSSLVPGASNIYVFAQNLNNGTLSAVTDARLAFYSIGESLDLALLDTRVTALITAIGAAIP